jgi:hypothetical protein
MTMMGCVSAQLDDANRTVTPTIARYGCENVEGISLMADALIGQARSVTRGGSTMPSR